MSNEMYLAVFSPATNYLNVSYMQNTHTTPQDTQILSHYCLKLRERDLII